MQKIVMYQKFCNIPKYRPLVIGLLILQWSSLVYAADIDLGVSTGAGYASNVFRSGADPTGDFYLRLTPKAVLRLPFHKVRFDSSSHAVLEQYANQKDLNLRELVFSGSGNYNPSHNVSFGLREQLLISGRLESIEELTDIITDVARQRDFVDNRISANFRYELRGGISALSLIYFNTTRDYRYTGGDDWILHTGQINVEYFLGYKTSVQAGLGLTKKIYERDIYYIRIPVSVSLKRELSDRIDARLSFASGFRRYNEYYKYQNTNETNVDLIITGKFNFMAIPRLTLRRRVYDSDYASGYAFVSQGGDVALNLNPIDPVRFTLRGIYSNNSYEQLKTTSDLYAGYVSMQYGILKWGAIVLGYGYRKSKSTVPALNYHRHVITLSLAGNATLWLI